MFSRQSVTMDPERKQSRGSVAAWNILNWCFLGGGGETPAIRLRSVRHLFSLSAAFLGWFGFRFPAEAVD